MEEKKPLQPVRWKKRPGFETFGMRMLYRCLYPFFRCSVDIPPELRDSGEPVVFVANHYEVFGPISFMISMPAVTRFWSTEELGSAESSAPAMKTGLQKLFPFLGERQLNGLARAFGKLAAGVMNHLGAIPVSRENTARLMGTMRRSIDALEAGENLLIFPETGEPSYSLTSVTPFYSGFAVLGRLYHRKTGKALRFCPCYIDEQHHQIRLGEPVTWRPEEDPAKETERVSAETNERIRKMAAENRGVEKETGMPARRTIQFFSNLIRLLLLIALIPLETVSNRGIILPLYCAGQGLRILFNAAGSRFSASNRYDFLFSHAVGVLTDLSLLIWLDLAGIRPEFRWLWTALTANSLILQISNVWAFFRFHRCAGVNYFDTVSANLLLAVILMSLLEISLPGPVRGVLLLAEMVTLLMSAGFAVAFNARIGKETETGAGNPETVAKQGAE